MNHILRHAPRLLAPAFFLTLAAGANPAGNQPSLQTHPVQTAAPRAGSARNLFVTANKSVVIDSPVDIQRVSVANGEMAEALVVNPREVVVNGKMPGQTSLLIWQEGGNRLLFDVTVRPSAWANDTVTASVQNELRKQLPGQEVQVTFDNKNVILSGTVKDLVSAERAAAIAATLGPVVNLLNVVVPPTDAQVLLKVRFANVDRAATSDLGVNLFSTGATGTIGRTTTGQFNPPNFEIEPDSTKFSLSDALNIFLFRRDLNLGATIKAMQSKRLLEILAEPNVLAINGKKASFLAGGEFPYPTLQGGGGGLGAVTIQFREFGVRITFLPVVTPRGTIRLQVTPEVSSLDYANGLVFQGFTIPGLSTRRVDTEIELEPGQSFAIGGLLDNRITETLSKIPGLGDVPLLGKLFQSRAQNKSNTELLVLVTPEVVRPIPAGQELPDVELPRTDFLTDRRTAPRTPGLDVTGPVPVHPPQETVPVEQLLQEREASKKQDQQQPQPYQFFPVPVIPAQPQGAAPDAQPQAAPVATPAAAAPRAGA